MKMTRYLVAAAAVLPVLLGVSTTANARDPGDLSPYVVCMARANSDCYTPWGPPDFSDPAQEAAYLACYAITSSFCNGLEGDPNNP